MTLSLKQFRESRKIKDIHTGEMYAYHGGFFANVDYDKDGNEVYVVVGEEFKAIEEAEVALYQMYCDEDRLTEGY